MWLGVGEDVAVDDPAPQIDLLRIEIDLPLLPQFGAKRIANDFLFRFPDDAGVLPKFWADSSAWILGFFWSKELLKGWLSSQYAARFYPFNYVYCWSVSTVFPLSVHQNIDMGLFFGRMVRSTCTKAHETDKSPLAGLQAHSSDVGGLGRGGQRSVGEEGSDYNREQRKSLNYKPEPIPSALVLSVCGLLLSVGFVFIYKSLWYFQFTDKYWRAGVLMLFGLISAAYAAMIFVDGIGLG